VCRPDAAQEAGERDALRGSEARESYAAICGVSEISLNRIYREAYDSIPEERRGSEGGVLGSLLP